MAQMSEEEFNLQMWQQVDPRPDQEKKEKGRAQRWLGAAILGIFVGCVISVLAGTGAAFLPGWFLGTVFIGSWLEGK
jgi:hypothetical protein